MGALGTVRMDEVPGVFRLPMALYGVLVAATLDASFRVMGAVARFEVEGREARDAAGAAIEACWHQDVWAPSWDAKRMPWPGSVVRKRYGAPIFVGDDLDAAAAEVEAALG